MAVRWMDSFQWATVATGTTLEGFFQERYSFANLDSGTTKGSVVDGPGPSNYLNFGSSTGDYLQIQFDDSPTEVYISFRLKQPSPANSSTTDIIRVQSSSGTEHFSINQAALKTWYVNQLGGSGGATDAFCPTDYYYGEWNHIELYLKTANSPDGEYDFRINGTTVSSGTGLDTQSFATGAYRIFIINPSITTGGGWQIRDLVIKDSAGSNNNTFTGEGKHVYQILPTVDTADEDWALSTGSDSFDLVNTVDPDDTTYIESSTAAEKTLFEFANSGSESGIDVVSVETAAALDSGTTTETFKNALDVSGSEVNGDDHDVSSTTIAHYIDFFEEDPNTAAGWVSSGVDGIKAGVEYV